MNKQKKNVELLQYSGSVLNNKKKNLSSPDHEIFNIEMLVKQFTVF